MNTKQDREILHFVGIAGSGMQPLAEFCVASGYRVQGSDLRFHKGIERLRQQGVWVADTHHRSNIKGAQKIIRSSAINAENPELVQARHDNLEILHRSELLAEILNQYKGICVTGSHGKTTTSAMITYVLEQLGCDPNAIIGGALKTTQKAFRSGQGELMIAEADESDGSLLRYKNPFMTVLTSLGKDHLDYFKSIDQLRAFFLSFLEQTDKDGMVVMGWDEPLLRELGHQLKIPKLTFGSVLGCDVRLLSTQAQSHQCRFEAMVERDRVVCQLPMIGAHNVANALCCLAVCRGLELNVADAAQALESFPGVCRRLETVFASDEIHIYDDYAHNPDKIAACLSGLRSHWPNHHISAIYQPHRYSRLETMYEDLVGCFTSCDQVWLLDVFSAGENSFTGFDKAKFAADIATCSRTKVESCDHFDDAKSKILKKPQKTWYHSNDRCW